MVPTPKCAASFPQDRLELRREHDTYRQFLSFGAITRARRERVTTGTGTGKCITRGFNREACNCTQAEPDAGRLQ
jgi:hypothetical protein